MAPRSTARPLTDRDREILALLTNGFTCREVAAKIGISHRTVEHYIEKLKLWFDQKRLHGLVAFALRAGLC